MNFKEIFRPGIKSFVLRAGRIGSGQQRALDTLSQRFCVPYSAAPLDTEILFGNDQPVVVEIGFGMGEATAALAAAHPELNYLALEVHVPGVGALLKRLDQQGINNVRIIQYDAVDVFRSMLGEDSVTGIHIFFPDPWHKKRHHKRRLIQTPFVELLTSRLHPGGYIHCATDWENYAEQILSVLSSNTQLRNSCNGYAKRPEHRPLTKFEQRGLGLGHQVWDIVFTKST